MIKTIMKLPDLQIPGGLPGTYVSFCKGAFGNAARPASSCDKIKGRPHLVKKYA